MKFIEKGRTPAELAKFKKDNAATPQVFEYDALPGADRTALRQRLLEEQGRLCAYTMRRIGEVDKFGVADFHLEHIRPQKLHPELSLDYRNIVLCAPGGDQPHCEWGAKFKGDTEVRDDNFVSPLRRHCESRFEYRPDGSVRVAEAGDAAAASTIKILKLNHRELIAQRLAALRSFGLASDAPKSIGALAADRLSRKICERSPDGDFEPYCVVVGQVASRLAFKTQRRAARLRGAR